MDDDLEVLLLAVNRAPLFILTDWLFLCQIFLAHWLVGGGGGGNYGFVLQGYISFSCGVAHFTEGASVSLKELFPRRDCSILKAWWTELSFSRWSQAKTSTISFFMVAELCGGVGGVCPRCWGCYGWGVCECPGGGGREAQMICSTALSAQHLTQESCLTPLSPPSMGCSHLLSFLYLLSSWGYRKAKTGLKTVLKNLQSLLQTLVLF